jgi:hypothetical protein
MILNKELLAFDFKQLKHPTPVVCTNVYLRYSYVNVSDCDILECTHRWYLYWALSQSQVFVGQVWYPRCVWTRDSVTSRWAPAAATTLCGTSGSRCRSPPSLYTQSTVSGYINSLVGSLKRSSHMNQLVFVDKAIPHIIHYTHLSV